MVMVPPQENIKSLQREDLESYIKTHYTAPRLVVAGAGAITHDELVHLAQTYFKDVPLTPMEGADTGMDAAKFTGSDKRIRVGANTMSHPPTLPSFPTRSFKQREREGPMPPQLLPLATSGGARRLTGVGCAVWTVCDVRWMTSRRRTWLWPSRARPGPRPTPSPSCCCR